VLVCVFFSKDRLASKRVCRCLEAQKQCILDEVKAALRKFSKLIERPYGVFWAILGASIGAGVKGGMVGSDLGDLLPSQESNFFLKAVVHLCFTVPGAVLMTLLVNYLPRLKRQK
jgi:hypothetical protein